MTDNAMTKEEIEQLRDIQGFIDWCIDNGRRQGYCLANISHDCGVLIRHADDGSAPRTGGYAKYRKNT